MEDRCPGVLRLHAAADGHLLRIRLPGGHLTVPGLEAIADLAELGNGLIELTSRASVQVRGLHPEDSGRAAERLIAAGLLPSLAHDRVRNILASPLAGRSRGALLDTAPVVAALDAGLCQDLALSSLPGRFLFAVEDGGGMLGGGQADVTLAAELDPVTGVRLRLHLGGRPTTRSAAADAAAGLALDSARGFMAVRERGPASDDRTVWRIADLAPADLDHLLERLEARWHSGPSLPKGRQPAPGCTRQADGDHAITALAPLGRLDARTARGLAALAASSGAALRVSPWRTVTIVDVPESQRAAVMDGLGRLGLVLDDASGWQNLSACAGLGACAKARIDVRAAGAVRAAVRAAATSTAIEHWSACERRCGRPPVVAHAITATSEGIEIERGGGDALRTGSLEDALALLAEREAPSPEGVESAPAERVEARSRRPVALRATGALR